MGLLIVRETGDRRGTVAEVAVWTIVSGAIFLAIYGLVSALGQSGVGFLLAMVFPPVVGLMLLLLLAGPATVLVAGVRKRRVAMVIGPLLLIPIVAAYSITSNWFEMRRMVKDIAALDMRDFSAASQHHDLVVIENTRHGQSTDCDDLCQQVLARTNYRVGVPGYSSAPIVYSKISDVECTATWDSKRNIRFKSFCATFQKVQAVDDGLLIMTPATWVNGGSSAWQWFPNLPALEFSGEAFALVERVPGQADRMLGRWVSGDVAIWPFHSGPIGKSFDRKDFYSAALILSFN